MASNDIIRRKYNDTKIPHSFAHEKQKNSTAEVGILLVLLVLFFYNCGEINSKLWLLFALTLLMSAKAERKFVKEAFHLKV